MGMNEYFKRFKDVCFIANGTFKEVYQIKEKKNEKGKEKEKDLVVKICDKNENPKFIKYLLNALWHILYVCLCDFQHDHGGAPALLI